ncbi:hypothetical protein HGE68_02610 [Rhodobacteraceae bacterium R_SAG6]|nr:hypothetical protein [Rhodobacteraceae bacterium G21628-S1]NKX28769.1 hypothetical protein [Rhodobacteraceae bacterium R_SAG6]
MASFIITYDTHAGRNYNSFYEGMNEHGGVRLAESVWGIRLNNTPAEVRDWVKGLLDDDDTIIVVQLKPKLSWGSRHASAEANEWLKENAQE